VRPHRRPHRRSTLTASGLLSWDLSSAGRVKALEAGANLEFWLWAVSPSTFKEGFEERWPPDSCDRTRARHKSTSLKRRINSRPRLAKTKEKPTGSSQRASDLPQRGEHGTEVPRRSYHENLSLV